jgi:hypothetical protein
MFERYTERARRVIFFARYEASQYGSDDIEAEHLLLGLVREEPHLIQRFVAGADVDIKKTIEERIVRHPKVSTSIDLPLTAEGKRVLAYANEEAERLNHRHIGTEHLLLGMLRESTCLAARILGEIGMKLDDVRVSLSKSTEAADISFDEFDEFPPSPDRSALNEVLARLPDDALARAKWMLERLLAHQSRGEREPSESFKRDTQGKVVSGRFSTTRVDNGTTVVETQQFVNGHQISITERFRLSDDSKTLSYSQEVVGPKPEQQHKHAMEFDVS